MQKTIPSRSVARVRSGLASEIERTGDIDSRRTVERDGKMRGARGELSYGDKNVRR